MSNLAALEWFSREYHDHNGDYCDILDAPPTALEFSRLAHISRPVLIKGYDIPASNLWNDDYLIQKLSGREISIAVTPNGAADAVTQGPDDKLYFTEPHIEKMTMAAFLQSLASTDEACRTFILKRDTTHRIEKKRKDVRTGRLRDIHYLQSQNGNLYNETEASEFEPLKSDVPSDVTWCSEAFDRGPDAVNLWIGGDHSVTSIHNDPYENIYTVIRGAKHFTLLPPTESWCLKERLYPHARYTRVNPAGPLVLTPSPPAPPIRWSSILNLDEEGLLGVGAHPIHITVNAGETLYLPPGWWHHVRQSSTDGATIAINWWYDVEPRGMGWVLSSFLRGGEVKDGNAEI